MLNTKEKYSQLIKAEAKRLGFLSCGIAKAGFLEEEAPRLESWLNKNHQGEMKYMENHFDKRLNPTLLVDDAKSVVSLLLNYYPSEAQNLEIKTKTISQALTSLASTSSLSLCIMTWRIMKASMQSFWRMPSQ